MKHELVDPLLRLHSAAIGAPKRAKPVTGPQPTHPMCAAMGRAYWAAEDVRVAWRRDGATITATVTREAPKCGLATTLPGWRKGLDVPVEERVGLWFTRDHSKTPGCLGARPAHERRWLASHEYRPAPPGVREGDAYSPALYGEEA
jgi:hypothetical protein